MRNHVTYALAVLLLAASHAFPQARQPASRPADPQIAGLIARLGHEDYQARQQAQDQLRRIGEPALPALREAIKSTDPEISSRAEALVREIENAAGALAPDPLEDVPGMAGVFIGPGGRAQVQVRIAGAGRVRHIVMREPNRTVTLHENVEGIRLTVSEPDRTGKLETREYKAKTPEQLKKEHPEAFTIYEQMTNMGAMRIRAIPPRMMPPRLPEEVQRMLRQQADPFLRMGLQQPAAAKFGMVLENADPAITAQLGAGVVVTDVNPGTRAARTGLRPFDLITKINQAKVESIDDVEKALGDKPVTIDLLRAGKSLQLSEEKKEDR